MIASSPFAVQRTCHFGRRAALRFELGRLNFPRQGGAVFELFGLGFVKVAQTRGKRGRDRVHFLLLERSNTMTGSMGWSSSTFDDRCLLDLGLS